MNAERDGWSRFWSKNLRRYIDCDFGLVPPVPGAGRLLRPCAPRAGAQRGPVDATTAHQHQQQQ